METEEGAVELQPAQQLERSRLPLSAHLGFPYKAPHLLNSECAAKMSLGLQQLLFWFTDAEST